MELIKQIKEAENKAKKLIEDAQKYTAETEEQVKKDRNDRLAEAQRQRKEAIAKSKEQGQAQGQKQAKEMTEKAAQQQQQLKAAAAKRKESAADKVIDFLRNRLTEKTQ
ncbi:MAG: hypothetical protein WC496_09770 [Phycisphaerae bacterium]|jgi:V/A-type H+-transporting ATPase subunit G/H